MINHCQLDMIHLLFVVSIIILYNDDISLFPTHNIKRGRLLMILFRLELVGFTPYKLIKKLNIMQVGLTCSVKILN